ncbi:MAG: lytic transglycosylase catalytic [Rhodocyclaceae bacterium]|nr:MAG: lytic transglycosylase catalytic [Rhodocyclaceae bacterium]TNC99481.1 MAG: lytic transglycosylase, catalytic [Rhodocyclaceae bacterium]
MTDRAIRYFAALLFMASLPALAAEPAPASPFRLHLADAAQYRFQSYDEEKRDDERRDEGAPEHPFRDALHQAAIAHGVDAALLRAVIGVESAWRADAVSPKGAIGLMQLMPDTARRFGTTRPQDPAANLKAGAAYLRHLIDSHDNLGLALAAYNAGEGAVQRYRGIPPYAETRQYVPKVLAAYDRFKASSASPYKLRLPAIPISHHH